MSITPLLLLGFGFLSGLKHAFEIDHVVALSTLTSKHKSFKRSSLLGMFWGFGHAISLFIMGSIVLFLEITIPEKISLSFEFLVGIMLVVLGINILAAINKNKIHVHKHKHGSVEHMHFHSHKLMKSHSHEHVSVRKSFIVGAIHGLAGSAALTLLVLTTINSTLLGLFYILIFSIGSILGMVLISNTISLPFYLISDKVKIAQKIVRFSSGSISLVLGLVIISNILLI